MRKREISVESGGTAASIAAGEGYYRSELQAMEERNAATIRTGGMSSNLPRQLQMKMAPEGAVFLLPALLNRDRAAVRSDA